MKKILVVLALIPLAIICSCQKQDLAAEQQLAQRKAELDAREKALDERENALAEREKAIASARMVPSDVPLRRQLRDPAQLKAEKERRLQALPPDLKGLVADPSQGRDEHEARMQERLAQRQRKMEEFEKARMAHAVRPFGEEATSPTPSPATQATSPSPSTTPE